MTTDLRFDICEAYYTFEVDYNDGGWLRERVSNQKRKMATHVQLSRMNFNISPVWKGYDSLSDQGKEIYNELERRYGFK